MSIRVVVADARRMVCEALAEALMEMPDIEVVVMANDRRSAVMQAQRVAADVVILSATLGEGIEEVSRELDRLQRPIRTLMLDHISEEQSLLSAVEAGADGYIGGEVGLVGLSEAIRARARGESVVPPALLGPLLRGLIQRRRDVDRVEDQLLTLTRREREVLSMLAAGSTPATIAQTLVISSETIRSHVQRILRKLEVHSQADAVALVVRAGMRERLERLVNGSSP